MKEQSPVRRATRQPTGSLTVLAESKEPAIRTEALHFTSTEPMEFWDVTDVTRDVVVRSGVRHGQVTVYSPHTTTTIVINESETGFLNDYRRVMDKLVPEDAYYEHDDHSVRTENLQEDEFVNGHAHCRQLMTGQPSVTVPVVDGEVLLGQWQRILFGEMDQARDRRVFFHAQGI